jgi:phosphonoacetaldehyde hydrolase
MSDSRDRCIFRGPLRAVLFDWAGTVLDFGSRAPVVAVMQTFAEFGVAITADEARGPMGMSKRDHLQAVLALPRVAEAWKHAQGEEPRDRSVDRLYAAFLKTQAAVIAAHAELIPGCLSTIEHCRRRNLKLGSSTGYVQELMGLLIPAARRQGLEFDAVVCADDVPSGRPAPWMLLENVRRLGVYPMAAALAVDDTTVGIQAGRNAGMWTAGVAKSGNLVGLGQEDFTRLSPAEQQSRLSAASQTLRDGGAHFVIETVADLPAILDEIDWALQSGQSP